MGKAVWVCVIGLFYSAAYADVAVRSRVRAEEALAQLQKFNWDDRAFVEKILKNRWRPVRGKKQIQEGPTCGYYATSHALASFDHRAPTGGELFDFAKRNGWYFKEEGSSISKNLADTVRGLGGYEVESGWGPTGISMKHLKALLRWGYGVVVGLQGVDDSGLPVQDAVIKIGGHWVAVEGFLTLNGTEYLIVKDSNTYGRQPDYVDKHLEGASLWPVSLFEDSWVLNSYVAMRPAR